MKCELTETCVFFTDGSIDSKAVELLKEAYCLGNQQQCARYMIFTAAGREHVPPTLYPNQTHLVAGIIKKAHLLTQPEIASCYNPAVKRGTS
jgi:hypothetical protein